MAQAMYRILDRPPDRPALQARAADVTVERAALRYEELLSDFTGLSRDERTDGPR